jgi:hypothetical protein
VVSVPTVVNLQAENLMVEPGHATTCEMSLANTGTIVEQFTIMVLGEVAPWTQSDPPVVSLFPGGQQTVTLRFSPPRLPTTPSGPVPFAVKVIPSNEPDESVTEEGTITVGSFNDVGAELVPRVATGRVLGRQRLAVDSRGNVPLPVTISALDAADALKFQIRPAVLTTAPGEARFVRVGIRPRQRFWKGPPQQKPYKVQITPENENPLLLDGALTQKAVLPKWVYGLVALLAAAVLVWFLLLKPAVHSDAVNANKSALAAQAAQTKSLAGQLSATQSSVAANSAAAAANAAAVAKLAGKKTPQTTTTSSTTTTTTTTVPKKVVAKAVTTTTATTQPPPVTGPNDGRIEVVAGPGSTASNSVTMLPHSTLQITDIVIQNVSGQAGRARVQRLAAGPGQAPEDLLVENLGTLNDQEYRFDTPIVFTSGQQLILSVDCQADQPACDVGIYYTGPLTEPAADTTTTFP